MDVLLLTWSAAVNAEIVAFCIADGLQSHGFTLAVPASLWGNARSHKTVGSVMQKFLTKQLNNLQ